MVYNVLHVYLLIPSPDSWLQDSGFRKTTVNHSLIARQLIHGYRGSKNNHNYITDNSAIVNDPLN